MKMTYNRGDIYYVDRSVFTGSEQSAGRPAIIVSNNKNNESSQTVEVVYLTTQPKRDLPTHVVIRSLTRESIAICEQVTTVAIERIGSYKGKATENEMQQIEIAMMISLGIDMAPQKEKVVEVVKEVAVPVEHQDDELRAELAATKAERDMLRNLYESLLSRVVGKAV